jgi:putative membrane protein
MKLWGVALAVGLLIEGGVAWTADVPVTSTVLGKLHEANQKEISMGKLAQKNGRASEVKEYGRTLVKDHTAADEKVMKLAKTENINLTANMPAPMKDTEMADMFPNDATFDAKFARTMLDDHERNIAEVTKARDTTQDDKLKKLLDELLPTLRQHRDTAQKILSMKSSRAAL